MTRSWRPQDEVPSFMTPEERAEFWADVQYAAMQTAFARPEPGEEPAPEGTVRRAVQEQFWAMDRIYRQLPWWGRLFMRLRGYRPS